jgi:heme/copper-type cytochrome/quinol oxidase subunit 2
MPKTKQISVTTTPAAITVQTTCKTVTISELQSPTWPTADFQIQAPTSSDDVMYRVKGLSWQFTAKTDSFFQPGTVVGYISLPSGGPVTFVQYEE